jgi:hypothetical protein
MSELSEFEERILDEIAGSVQIYTAKALRKVND